MNFGPFVVCFLCVSKGKNECFYLCGMNIEVEDSIFFSYFNTPKNVRYAACLKQFIINSILQHVYAVLGMRGDVRL